VAGQVVEVGRRLHRLRGACPLALCVWGSGSAGLYGGLFVGIGGRVVRGCASEVMGGSVPGMWRFGG